MSRVLGRRAWCSSSGVWSARPVLLVLLGRKRCCRWGVFGVSPIDAVRLKMIQTAVLLVILQKRR